MARSARRGNGSGSCTGKGLPSMTKDGVSLIPCVQKASVAPSMLDAFGCSQVRNGMASSSGEGTRPLNRRRSCIGDGPPRMTEDDASSSVSCVQTASVALSMSDAFGCSQVRNGMASSSGESTRPLNGRGSFSGDGPPRMPEDDTSSSVSCVQTASVASSKSDAFGCSQARHGGASSSSGESKASLTVQKANRISGEMHTVPNFPAPGVMQPAGIANTAVKPGVLNGTLDSEAAVFCGDRWLPEVRASAHNVNSEEDSGIDGVWKLDYLPAQSELVSGAGSLEVAIVRGKWYSVTGASGDVERDADSQVITVAGSKVHIGKHSGLSRVLFDGEAILYRRHMLPPFEVFEPFAGTWHLDAELSTTLKTIAVLEIMGLRWQREDGGGGLLRHRNGAMYLGRFLAHIDVAGGCEILILTWCANGRHMSLRRPSTPRSTKGT